METVILGLGLLVFIGHLLMSIFKRTRVPDVLILIFMGIIVGPGLGWIRPGNFGDVGAILTIVALIVILFEGGVSISWDSVGKSAVGALSLTLVSSAITVGLVAVLLKDSLGGWLPAFITGAILSGTSSAVVIPMINALRVGERCRTILSMESALTDVTCIVLTVGLLDAALHGDISGARLAGKAISSMVSAGLVGLIGGIGWMLVHNRLRSVPNTRMAVVAGVLVLYGISESMGFSGGIAALSFGITIAHWGSDRSPSSFLGLPLGQIAADERELFSELAFLCKLLFFVYLGISLRFDNLSPFIDAAKIIAVIYLARILVVRYVLSRECSWRDAAMASLMAPKGLAAAVIAASIVQSGLDGGEAIRDLVYAAVLVSIVTTSILVPLVDLRPMQWLSQRFFHRHAHQNSTPATQATLSD